MRSRDSDGQVEDTAPRPPVRRDRRTRGRSARAGGTAPIPIYIWFLGLIVVLLVMAVAGLWALYLMRGQWTHSGPTPTPIIWTPTPMPRADPTPTSTEEPPSQEMEIPPTVSPHIAVGTHVRVTGTGGDGLNLRQGPGANYPRKDIALEGEVFIVSAGPTMAADVEWWKIRDPGDPARDWWAAANFLEPIEAP